MQTLSRTKKIVAASTLVLAGFGGGAAVALTSAASAEETPAAGAADGPGGSGETPLAGNVLEQVTAAVLAEYPGATIERAETDTSGVYEAHILTADGEPLTVLVDDDYAVTGTESGRPAHGPGGPGGHGGPGCDDASDTASDTEPEAGSGAEAEPSLAG